MIEEALANNPPLCRKYIITNVSPVCWAIELNCDRCLKNLINCDQNIIRTPIVLRSFPIEMSFYFSPYNINGNQFINYHQSYMTEHRLNLSLLLLENGADVFELWNGIGWTAKPQKSILPFKIAIRAYGFSSLNKVKMYSLLERVKNTEAEELLNKAVFVSQYHSQITPMLKSLTEQCIICIRRHSLYNVLHTVNNLQLPRAMKLWILLDPDESNLLERIR